MTLVVKMKNILVVNDDGINAPGIRAAARAVKGLGKVIVVAPAVQQSGVGRSISLFSPIKVSRGKLDGFEAYSIDGTPVDAVIVGMYGILKSAPDLIVSGINVGENMSTEATTSGTVGAALEGANQGVPAIAVSMHASEEIKFEDTQPQLDFSFAQKVIRRLAKQILKRGLPKGIDLLNVNVPENSKKCEIKITRLAKRMYTTKVKEDYDPRGRAYFWIDGDAIYDAEEGTDVHAVRVKRCVSVTPLKLDFTSYEGIAGLRKLTRMLR